MADPTDVKMTIGVEVPPAELDRAVRQIMSLGQKVKPVSIPVSLVGGEGGDAQMALQNLFRKLEKDAKKALKIHVDLGGTAAEAGREASMSVKHVIDTLAKDPAWAGLKSHMEAVGVSAASHVIAGFEKKLASSQLAAAVQRKAEYKANLGTLHSQLRGGSAESKALSRLGEAGQRSHEAAKLIGDPEATRRLAGEQIEILRKYAKEVESLAKASGVSSSDAARQAQTSIYRLGKQYGVSMPGMQSAATEFATKRSQADAARAESHRQQLIANQLAHEAEIKKNQLGPAAPTAAQLAANQRAVQAENQVYGPAAPTAAQLAANQRAVQKELDKAASLAAENRARTESLQKQEEKAGNAKFKTSSIKASAKNLMVTEFGNALFSAAEAEVIKLKAEAEAKFGKTSPRYKRIEADLHEAFGPIVESRMAIGEATTNAIARQKLTSMGGPSGNRQSSEEIRRGLEKALADQIAVQSDMEDKVKNGKASPGQKAQAFHSRSNVVQLQNDIKKLGELEKLEAEIVERMESRQKKGGPGKSGFFSNLFGAEARDRRALEQVRAHQEDLAGGGSARGKMSAHGAQFAAMNAAYGFQDFFQVLAQPGMGPGRAFLAAANNIGPALGAVSSSVGPTVAIGAVMAAMAGLQFVMQKNEDTLRKNKESADRLAESFKRLAVSAAQIGRSLPLGSQTGMGGAMEMQNAILGRAPMAGAMLNGMQARSMESERTRASSGMGFWGSTGRYWGDMFSRVGTDKSPSAVKQHLFGRIKSRDEIPSMVGGGRDFDVRFSEKTGQMVRRPTAERDKMVAEYEAAMLERQKQRKAMEESGDTALIEQEYLRNQEAMSQLGQMKKFSKGIGSRSRSGFQEALSDSRKFGDKGIATGYVQNLYGDMQQSAMAAKRAKQNLQFLEENEPARAGQLRSQLSSLSGKQDVLNKAGRGGEAEIVGQEIIDVKNQLMAFDNELKEANESVAVFSQVATETEAAFMSIASNYKKGIRDAGESGKTTMIQSSDLWSRIQDSLTGNDVERQQLSVLEKILSAISGKEKLGSLKIGALEGNDSGGYAGGGKKPSARDTILAKLREGEVVLTPEHQARLAQRLKMSPSDLFGGMGMTHKGSSLSAWANVGGFDGGGTVGRSGSVFMREGWENPHFPRLFGNFSGDFKDFDYGNGWGGSPASTRTRGWHRAFNPERGDERPQFDRDRSYSKWLTKQRSQRSFFDRQSKRYEDEEPFRDRYSQYKTQSGRLGMSGFYRNQGVPLYGRGAGGRGGRTLSGPRVPSVQEAWPGGMPFMGQRGSSLPGFNFSGSAMTLPEERLRESAAQSPFLTSRGRSSMEEAAKQREFREFYARQRGYGDAAGNSKANAEQLAEMKRRGMSSRSVDVMAGVQSGSAERAAEARRQQAMGVQRQAEQSVRKGEFQEKAKADEQERLARKSAAQKEAAEKTEKVKADYKKRLEEAKESVKSGKGFVGGAEEDPEAKEARLEAGRERLRKKADEKWAPKEEYVPFSSHYAGESKEKNRKETLGEKLVRENEERFSKFEKDNPSSGGGPGSSAGMTPGEKSLKDQKDRLNNWRGGLGDRMEGSFPTSSGELGDTPPESSRTVRGGDRLGRWRAGQEDDKKMREEGNRLQMDAYKKHYDELPQKLMQNVSGQEQAASGVGFGGNDRNTAVLERIAETLITSSRDSAKASDKVVSAIEGSGISIS